MTYILQSALTKKAIRVYEMQVTGLVSSITWQHIERCQMNRCSDSPGKHGSTTGQVTETWESNMMSVLYSR